MNNKVVTHGMLVHPSVGECCTCAVTCSLHECLNSTLDVVVPDIRLNLSYISDCISIGCTKEMSNLDIKLESMLCFYGFDPTKYVVHAPPMFRLILDCKMSLDTDAIFTANSQLVFKALGVSWAMPLKQWLSWLKSLGSFINNTCPMLCYSFMFDNG